MNTFQQNHPLDAGFQEADGTEPLEINETVTRSWTEMAGWCTFLGGIMFFVVLTLLLAARSAMDSYFGIAPGAGIAVFIICLFSIGPAIMYWRTGSKIRLGFLRQENETLEDAFSSLLWAYRYTGVISGLVFLFILLAVFFSIYNNLQH